MFNAGTEEAGLPEQEGRLSRAQLEAELATRERTMQQSQGGRDGPTDQWRVYSHILDALEHGPFLRLVVQASAGTGKSYLLTTVYLWCLLHGKNVRAAAPTGIAEVLVSQNPCIGARGVLACVRLFFT